MGGAQPLHQGPDRLLAGGALVKRMTQEELLTAFETLAGMNVTSRAFRASERIRQHLVAVEAEAAQARERALEEAATYCDDRAQAAMDACRETRSARVRVSLGRIAERMHDAGEGIRALRATPAQEAPRDISKDCTCLGFCRGEDGLGQGWRCVLGKNPVEMASEENGLLPEKRRREHEYGEDKMSHFGSWVADCVRPGCQAFRVKNRKKTGTAFRQAPGAPPTDEPGPCEVEL